MAPWTLYEDELAALFAYFVQWLHTDEFGSVEPGEWLETERLCEQAKTFLHNAQARSNTSPPIAGS